MQASLGADAGECPRQQYSGRPRKAAAAAVPGQAGLPKDRVCRQPCRRQRICLPGDECTRGSGRCCSGWGHSCSCFHAGGQFLAPTDVVCQHRAAPPAADGCSFGRCVAWVADTYRYQNTLDLSNFHILEQQWPGPCTGRVRMEGSLAQPAVGYLWDHRIAGRELLPAAAMLEIAAAATFAALGSSAGATSSAALTVVSIPAPLVLPTAASSAPRLAVEVDARLASISVESQQAATSWKTHLRASVACIAQLQSSATTAAGLAPADSRQAAASATALLGVKEAPQNLAAYGSLEQRASTQPQEYFIDPAVLDNCTQVMHSPLSKHSSSPWCHC